MISCHPVVRLARLQTVVTSCSSNILSLSKSHGLMYSPLSTLLWEAAPSSLTGCWTDGSQWPGARLDWALLCQSVPGQLGQVCFNLQFLTPYFIPSDPNTVNCLLAPPEGSQRNYIRIPSGRFLFSGQDSV